MVRSTGRAIHHTSKAVHRLLALATGLLVIMTVLLAAASWRLAQGPIDLGGWSDRLRTALIDDSSPVRVSFESMFLAWEGFNKGVDYPLDLRLSDITVTDPAGHRLVAAPRAHLTFSLAGLLMGRFVPRAIEVDHAQIALTREPGGAIDIGGLTGDTSSDTESADLGSIREQLSHPAGSDHGRALGLLDQIQRIHFRDTGMTLRDRASGLAVRTNDMDLDLTRIAGGHVQGSLRAPLFIGGQAAELASEADWAVGADTRVDIRLTSLRPAGVGALPPALAFMAGIDVPVSLTATVRFDTDFKPVELQTQLQAGQGEIRVAQGNIPVRSASIDLTGTPDRIAITRGHFDLAHTPDGDPEIVDITGTVTRAANRLSAALTLALGHLDVAGLPRLWPPGIGGGARPWVVEHITAGTVTRAAGSLVIESDDAFHDVVLTKATGELDGTNGTFTWIDNVPPVEQTEFQLHLVDPDTLDIHVSSAQQRVRNGGADLTIDDGQMRITGLSLRDQIAVIHTRTSGSVPSVMTLLKEPRLHLLSAHPIAVKPAAGDVAATLDFQFPLENKLQIEEVDIHASAHLTKVRLQDVAGGQDLTDGMFDLDVNKEGLTLKGQGSVAAIPVAVDGSMDFRPGPPDGVAQKFAITGQADAARLDAAGLHVTDVLAGTIPLTVVMIDRRGGEGSIAINADLTLASLSVSPLAWSKPSGTIATASAMLLLSHDRLTKIDQIAVRGEGLLVAGSADLADGHARTVRLDILRLGRTLGHGTIHLGPNQPIAIVLQADPIDLSAKLTEKMSGGDNSDPPTTPAWTLDARFDHAILANGERANDVVVKATGGGQTVSLLDVAGSSPAGPGQAAAGFAIKIEPRSDKRHLIVQAQDAGTFLRGLDAIRGMKSGRLAIDAMLDKPFGMHPMAGTATIDDTVVKNSPVLGKLLQAITLYGLVDALGGPGMAFSHIVVPFHYDGTDLSLDEAHASNSSLGLTAAGRINLTSGQSAITGTIVPAYFFNSMLGHLPLVGKLFSPEKGGGVFAARFGVEGQIADPSISINPVSALTPGFLREIFSIFDRAPAAKESGRSEVR